MSWRQIKALVAWAVWLWVLTFAGLSQAAITFFWSFEGNSTTLSGTLDYVVGGGDNTATGQGSPSIGATGALAGSYGFSGTGSAYRFTPTSIIDPNAGSVGFLIRIQTFNASQTSDIFYARANLSSNTYWALRGSNTDELRLTARDNGSASLSSIDTTAVNLATNTTYFITFSWDVSAPARRICVYNSSGTLVTACTVDTTAFTAPAAIDGGNNLYFGDAQAGTFAYYLDNIMVGSAYADADTFICNYNITDYSHYAACGGGGSSGVGNLLLLGVGK